MLDYSDHRLLIDWILFKKSYGNKLISSRKYIYIFIYFLISSISLRYIPFFLNISISFYTNYYFLFRYKSD